MEKTKNCWVIPTDKPSSLIIYNSKLKLVNYPVITPKKKKKHVYITSDEEIKEGDVVKIPCGVGKVKELTWKFGNDNPSYIIEDIFIYKLRYGQKEGELQINSFRYEDVKKIVITTDQDLIKDGVQAIDDEFLEWLINNSNCEEIEVVDVRSLGVYGSYYPYKINIPKKESETKWDIDTCRYFDMEVGCENEKCICENISKEEPKTKCYCGHTTYCDCGVDVDFEIKQETLEEAAERLYPISPQKRKIWINGAKWQQEQEQSNENSWFNEYQEVENYIIKRIGNKFLEATPEKYNTASEATIALLENNWKQDKKLYNEEDLREAFRQGEQNINYSEIYGLDSKLTEQEWFEKLKKK